MKNINRRGFMSLLPAAPAVAREVASDMVGKVARATTAMRRGREAASMPTVMSYGDSPHQKAHDWMMDQLIAGKKVDPLKEKAFRDRANTRSLLCEDVNIEALHSISPAQRSRMHKESAYRRIVAEAIEEHQAKPLWKKMLLNFGNKEEVEEDLY